MKDWPSYRSWNCHLHCITRVATPKVQLCLQLQKEIHQFLIELQLPEVGFEPGTSGVTVWHATNWAMVTWLETQLFCDIIAQLLGIGNYGFFVTWPLQPLKWPQHTPNLFHPVLKGQASNSYHFLGLFLFFIILEHFRHSNGLWG